jgi:hypothetical protein
VLELQNFANTDKAKGIEQNIQAMLLNLAHGNGRAAANVQSVSIPIEDAKLPVEISSAVPTSWGWASFLQVLFAYIIPQRKVVIRGVLLEDSLRGAGITTEVRLSGGEAYSETFWAKEFAPNATKTASGAGEVSHHALAETVAIWLLYRLSEGPLTMLGTRNWRSYAYFRSGVNTASRVGAARTEPERAELESAKAFYLKALQADDRLHAARLNLALLAEGAERGAIRTLLLRATEADRTDATRYQARYALAIRVFDNADAAQAIEHATELFRDIHDTAWRYGFYGVFGQARKALALGDLPWWQKPRQGWLFIRYSVLRSSFLQAHIGSVLDRLSRRQPHKNLERYLENVLPIALAMWVGLKVRSAPNDPAVVDAIADLEKVDHSPRLLYNLACVESLRASVAGTPGEKSALLAKCLERLQLALWMSADLGRAVRADKSLDYIKSSVTLVSGVRACEAFEALVNRLAPSSPKA